MFDLANSYRLRDQDAVSHYLDKHPFLVPLLSEVDVRVRQYFDVNSPLILEVVREFASGSEEDDELFAIIPTTLPPEEAVRRRCQFGEEWWLEASNRGRHRMNIGIEYV